MQESSRSQKTLKNIIYGFGSQFIITFIPFITRTVFIHRLGIAYLGVNSLFASILNVLSLAELGIGNIVVYSLYKPIAENNNIKIASLVKFYRNIYRGISLTVLCIGLLILPFLDFIVNLPEGMDHIRLYYVMFVLNSSISYLYVYKSSIINADQKQYIVSLFTAISTVVQNVVQIIIVLLFNSFLLYLAVQLAFTFLLNLSLSIKANHLYKLDLKNAETLSKEEKRTIINNTKSMVVYKLGGTFLNSTDSIYISTLISTVAVGLYNNYVTLEGVLNRFINLVYNGIYASVGNLNASEDRERQKTVYDALCLMFFVIGTIGFAGFYTVSSDIINIWIGKDYIIDKLTVLAISIRFYMPIILYPIWMYRNTTGVFKETQNILIYAGILNLIFSYFLGKWIGLAGIIFATSISRLLTSFWYEPYILYKKRFENNHVWEYFFQCVISAVISAFTVFFVTICFAGIGSTILRIGVKMVTSVAIPAIAYYVFYYKKPQMTYLIQLVLKRRRKNA